MNQTAEITIGPGQKQSLAEMLLELCMADQPPTNETHIRGVISGEIPCTKDEANELRAQLKALVTAKQPAPVYTQAEDAQHEAGIGRVLPSSGRRYSTSPRAHEDNYDLSPLDPAAQKI